MRTAKVISDRYPAVDIVIKYFSSESITEEVSKHLERLYQQLCEYELELTKLGDGQDNKELISLIGNMSLDSLDQLVKESLIPLDNCLLAYINGAPVGMLTVDKGAPYEIGSLYVVQEWRNHEVGATLVREFSAMINRQPIEVKCYSKNTKAIKFYNRLGFVFDRSGVVVTGVGVIY